MKVPARRGDSLGEPIIERGGNGATSASAPSWHPFSKRAATLGSDMSSEYPWPSTRYGVLGGSEITSSVQFPTVRGATGGEGETWAVLQPHAPSTSSVERPVRMQRF